VEVLYVTSFDRDMYAATGVHLLDSFVSSGTQGTLLCCSEGGLANQLSSPDRAIVSYDLDSSEFLRTWLEANRDIIPIELGGQAQPCTCPGQRDPWGIHVERCPYHWFNKNASRWFRKVVSLEHAMRCRTADALIWIDCDCRFKKGVASEFWADLFGDAVVLYHKGPARSVVESGVLAIRLDELGRQFLDCVLDMYRSGSFRNEVRWDDGYIVGQVILRNPGVPSKDLASRGSSFDPVAPPREYKFGFVLPDSPIGEYIDHFKGVHGAVLRLMR